MKKVLVSLPEPLIAAIDAQTDNRSHFIQQALEAFLDNPFQTYESEKSRKEREFDEFLGVKEWQEYLAAKREGK